MKLLMLLLVALVLQGCITIKYGDASLTSVFKSIEGVYIRKEGDLLEIKVDKTHTGDPIQAANDILDIAERVSGG